MQEESELQEIAKVIGQDVLSDDKKLVLEVCRAIRLGFLQQSAMNENDTCVPIEKQFIMMKTTVDLFKEFLVLVEKGIPFSNIKELGIFDELIKLKYTVSNQEIEKYDDFYKYALNKLTKLDEDYKEHT